MNNNTYEIKNVNELIGLNNIIKRNNNSYRDLILKGNIITKIIANLNIILLYNQKIEIEEDLDTFIPSTSQNTLILPYLNRRNNSFFDEIIAMGCKNTSLSSVIIYVDIDVTLKELLSCCFCSVPINHIFVNNTNYDKLIPTIDSWSWSRNSKNYFEISLYDSVGDVNIIKQYSKVSYNKFTRTLQIDTDEATAAEISLLLLFDDDK